MDIEIDDQLTRHGSSLPLTGPQPGPGITAKHARGVIRGWMSRKQGVLAVHLRTKAG